MRLQDLARVIRSKNAGPRLLTLDVICAGAADFERLRSSHVLSAESVARLYGVSPAEVRVIEYAASHAVKVTLPRPLMAGSVGDRDVYGAQQHARLFDLPV
jgi:hypothetical protein